MAEGVEEAFLGSKQRREDGLNCDLEPGVGAGRGYQWGVGSEICANGWGKKIKRSFHDLITGAGSTK